MRNVAKLVALDMGALYSGTHKYRGWSYLVAFLIVLIAFLNGDAATPLAGAITGTSVGILMMPFASVDRHGLEQLYTMLPIRRREIVASHYLFGLLVMLMIDLYAAFIVAGPPTSAITELATTNGVNLINIDGTVRDKILSKCPYYKTYTIPADTYPGQTEPVSTITVQATVVVSAQADEDTVYKLTSAIFDHVDDITKENAKGAELKLETATSITTVPYHAGAAKYYAEHGITVNTDE